MTISIFVRKIVYTAIPAFLSVALMSGLSVTQAAHDDWHHGLSLVGEPKYPPGFTHFDYVNVDAPKGGILRRPDTGAFDSLNFVPNKGVKPTGLGLIYDALMTSSMDEISTEYGLVAEGVRYPEDFSSVTFKLNESARWHDGKPITVDDVLFSFSALTEHNPLYRQYYANVVSAEKAGDHEVTFKFDQSGNRELPQIMGQLIVLPKHWWEGVDADGDPRDISATTLEHPLGSGPYRIKSAVNGRSIVYERVDDYWARDHPVNVGAFNFDEIRYEIYRDITVQFEAFKGDELDFYVDATSKNWSTGYNFPAVEEGRIVKEAFPQTHNASGRMQAWIFNLRKDKFSDPNVRRAFNLAYNFEEMNQNLFYGLYRRIDSFFEGTELEATGLPEGRELEILETVRDQIPAEVFTEPYSNPQTPDAAAVRSNLREADRLLNEAGWVQKDGKRVNAETGEAFSIEMLSNDPRSERTFSLFRRGLERLGIETSLRIVDTSQYQNRLLEFDFDMISTVMAQSLSPGNEQREFWSTEAADQPGSRNRMGIKNPAVDTLIDRVVFATDREDLIAATKALDRVLLWNHYVIPQWISGETWTARWNRFGHPDPLPKYSIGFPTIWWWDADKAASAGNRS